MDVVGESASLRGDAAGAALNGQLEAAYRQAPVGTFGGDPYANSIASASFLDDRAVVHANLGMISRTGPTWGLGLEALLVAPRVYGIAEVFGQRSQTPTLHYGLRFWVIPNRFQIDATQGHQAADPEKHFFSVGIRLLF